MIVGYLVFGGDHYWVSRARCKIYGVDMKYHPLPKIHRKAQRPKHAVEFVPGSSLEERFIVTEVSQSVSATPVRSGRQLDYRTGKEDVTVTLLIRYLRE